MPSPPPKAYKDMAFLNSDDARILRIMAEYLEPRSRFNREAIKDTVVFFGSSRIIDKQNAQKELDFYNQKYGQQPSEENKKYQKIAAKKLEMSRYYEDARALAGLLTQWSFDLPNPEKRFVVTSGGGPGIMEAANRGASEISGGKSIGLNISLPMEQGHNPYITDELNFEFHYFFTRKFWFIYLAKGVVIFPGGFGTLDELWEVLTLCQTKKVQKKMPMVLYGESYWKQLINFDYLIETQVIDEQDMGLIHFSSSPEDAFKYLKKKLTEHFL